MKKLFSLAVVAAMLFATACASLSSEAGKKDLLHTDPRVESGTLDNGLSWVVMENSEPENRIQLRLVVRAGSVLEDDDQRGIAHLVEHMAFKGTKSFAKEDLVDYFETIGMEFGPEVNAYTSFATASVRSASSWNGWSSASCSAGSWGLPKLLAQPT